MKSLYKKIIFIFFAGTIVFGFHACKSKKQIVYSVSPVEEKENREVFTDILNNEFRYNTLSSRFNMSLATGTRSLSSKANLKIEKDKAIQISIQPLFGVEMFRLHVTPDTLVLLDRMNKRYVQEAIDDVKKSYPVGFDFETLQALFSNHVFVAGKNQVEDTDYRNFQIEKASDMHYLLKATDRESAIEYTFTIDGSDRVAFTHLLEPKKKYSLQWQYADFAVVGHQTYPSRMDVNVESPRRKLNIGFNFSDIQADENFQLGIAVPSGYTKASVADILKILTAN